MLCFTPCSHHPQHTWSFVVNVVCQTMLSNQINSYRPNESRKKTTKLSILSTIQNKELVPGQQNYIQVLLLQLLGV